MLSWTWNRTMDISNRGAVLLIDFILVCWAAYLLWKRESEQKEKKRQPEQEKEGERESENNKSMKERVSEGWRQERPYWVCLMRKSVQGSLSSSLISEPWLRRGARKDEGREGWGERGGEWGEKKNSENKLLPIQYSWIKSWLRFTLIFFHYV